LASDSGLEPDAELLKGSEFQNAVVLVSWAWDLKAKYLAAPDTKSKAKLLFEEASSRHRTRYSSGASAPVAWARWELRSLCEKDPLDVASAVVEAKAEVAEGLTDSLGATEAARSTESMFDRVLPWLTQPVIDIVE
jgi:hypothetical protein